MKAALAMEMEMVMVMEMEVQVEVEDSGRMGLLHSRRTFALCNCW